VIVSEDGVVLTAQTLIRGSRGFQVRLKNGETYDRVRLIATDGRRGVAALRIPATGLRPLRAAPGEPKSGGPVWVVAHPGLRPWTATAGMLGAPRLADEIPGFGSGYQLLPLTAAVGPGSLGAPVVDAEGNAVGIVLASGVSPALDFAIPLMAVMGLAQGRAEIVLGQPVPVGFRGRPPERSPASVANADPDELVRRARSMSIYSSTQFFDAQALENALSRDAEFQKLSVVLVRDSTAADLLLRVERPLFSFDFTYRLEDARSSVVVGTGKVIAVDGVRAAPLVAKEIVKRLRAAKASPVASPKKN
jgi:hypothetical protein